LRVPPPLRHGGQDYIKEKVPDMLYYALIFLLIAIVAGALGFVVLAGTLAWLAKIFFVLFLVLFIVSLVQRRRL
jgi:uncharacterized membrane protein YtjA (UPF0391 family)